MEKVAVYIMYVILIPKKNHRQKHIVQKSTDSIYTKLKTSDISWRVHDFCRPLAPFDLLTRN